MGIEELDFEFSFVDDEATDDWLRARRLRLEADEEPRAKRALARMENTELVEGKTNE